MQSNELDRGNGQWDHNGIGWRDMLEVLDNKMEGLISNN